MKILIFNWRDISNPQAGGAEVYLHQIGKRLAIEHEVVLYCQRYKGSSRRDEIDGIRVIRRGGVFSGYLYAILDYLFSLRRENFDIVVDDINGVPFFTPLFVTRPKVAVIHHLVGREVFFKELPFPMSLIGWVAERMIPLVYRRARVVTVSRSTKDELIRFGIGEGRISIIHNAVDPPSDELLGGYTKPEVPTVVYLGRIKAYKQLDHLLEAFSVVIHRMPHAELVIAGRGDYTKLARLAEALGIVRSVRLMGEVSEEEKIEVLSKAWVFVTPSLKEGWGVSVIEANACGTPAIAYNVPGLRDSIRDGETGLLVTPGHVGELADAILTVLGDPALRARLSRNARDWALSFSWGRSAEEFTEVIRGVLSGK